MASTTKSTSATNSGIKKLSNGESIIPSSIRADGSVRKEIRVKPGYKPPEDVEVYKNRTAEGWRNKGKGGVPGADTVTSDEGAASRTAAQNKNAKRREARKKAAAASGVEDEHVAQGEKNDSESRSTLEINAKEELDPEAEQAKEARKLAKKLRQARDLEEKKDKGADLLPEQFAKVIKINELIRQLDSLGFDTNGEKKESVKPVPD
jgi:partner of Y14 and mago